MPSFQIRAQELTDSRTLDAVSGGDWQTFEQRFRVAVCGPSESWGTLLGTSPTLTLTPEQVYGEFAQEGFAIDAAMPTATTPSGLTVPLAWQQTGTASLRPRCRRFRVEPDPSRAHCYLVSIVWETLWSLAVDPYGDFPGEPAVRVNMTAQPRTANVWKIGRLYDASTGEATDFIPAGGNDTVGGNLIEIGDAGASAAVASIDDAGAPQRIEVPGQRFSITWPMSRGSYASGNGAQIEYPCWRAMADLQGCRNSIAFMGFPAGSLLWEGVDYSQQSHAWSTVTLSLVWDRWSHLQQRPARLLGGDIVTEGITVGGITRNVAKSVYWWQPYPDTFFFADAFASPWFDDVIAPIVASKLEAMASCGTGALPGGIGGDP